MTDSSIETFNRLVRTDLPARTPKLFGTACVLGGSIAGLLAARVLADHASEVVIVERDEPETTGRPRAGVPQDRHGHALLPGGLKQLERWLPGVVDEVQALGGHLAPIDQQGVYYDGRPRAQGGDAKLLLGSRPFLEARIRNRVLALPNVSTVTGLATGLVYTDDGRVGGVQVGSESVAADFVVDAMGRASRLSSWLEQAGYQRPVLERMPTGIHYVTGLFERTKSAGSLEEACVLDLISPRTMPFDLTVASVNVIEDDQWLVMFMSYEEQPAARSLDAFRSVCDGLPPIFRQATSGEPTRGLETYHQADSRRRDFAGLTDFPAGLVAVGDAVASFNPIYGQGISSAALHASCLSEYLTTDPDLSSPATDFFALQQVITDAAWTLSAGADAARHDAITGTKASAEVEQQRWAMNQIIQATLTDPAVTEVFAAVTFMDAHPGILADPAFLDRALAANRTDLAARLG
ncbi:FAD-dependent oxidoreductase [Kribbella sp. NPDC056345]|uniref:FAD-dependent oxidoreductase n=1 Tax=Kribbella sp. NPDC056345 TaxID=3345789 RepID=UPI0035E2347E